MFEGRWNGSRRGGWARESGKPDGGGREGEISEGTPFLVTERGATDAPPRVLREAVRILKIIKEQGYKN